MAKTKTQMVTLELETTLPQRTIGSKKFWNQLIVWGNNSGLDLKVKQAVVMTADSSKKGGKSK